MFALALFLFGTLGSFAELLLVEHTEQLWQLLPLFLMGGGILALAWTLVGRSRLGLQAFRGVMVLFVSSGLLGVYLHYRGNVEFELEMYPSMAGLELFWEALKGATPTLAPAMMIELGLLGWAFTYRHPRLGREQQDATDTEDGV